MLDVFSGRRAGCALIAALTLWACDSNPGVTPGVVDGEVFIGAGDIAYCGGPGDDETAIVIDSLLRLYPDASVFAAGDNVYPTGSAQDYANCYQPTWGRFKSRTWAVIGNHDYDLGNADATFDYFGARVGPRGLGYYSFDLGDWHVLMLNSNETFVSAAAGSPQEQWLRADLAANSKACIIAVFHHPLFSSCSASEAERNDCAFVEPFVRPVWNALHEYGAEVVVNGHRHWYERFALLDPAGTRDPVGGMRQFIVGTGGRSVGTPSEVHPMSELQNDSRNAFGVLKLILKERSYSWEFVPIRGRTFRDSGGGMCTVP